MKKSSKIRLVVMVVLAISIAAPTIMYAAQQVNFWHKPCITRWDLFKLMRDIKITDQQKTDLKDIGMQTITDIQPIVQQMDALRKQMTATFLASEIDTAQAESQISEMIELNSQIADIMLHAKLQEAQVLTPEQRARIYDEVWKLKKNNRQR